MNGSIDNSWAQIICLCWGGEEILDGGKRKGLSQGGIME